MKESGKDNCRCTTVILVAFGLFLEDKISENLEFQFQVAQRE